MMIERRSLLALLAGGGILIAGWPSAATEAGTDVIKVYKDPSCQCCAAWAQYLVTNGFMMSIEARNDLPTLKQSLGVPDALTSCHTATIRNYVLEGHVPAREIKRLLAEKPKARGLSVPGMPNGAPGMEVPGQPKDRFEVVLFDASGKIGVFASYDGAQH